MFTFLSESYHLVLDQKRMNLYMYAVVCDMDLCNVRIAYSILDIPLHKCKQVYFYS